MRTLRWTISALLLACLAGVSSAQTTAEAVAAPAMEEMAALRQQVQKQGREIEDLRVAVDELSKVVRLREGSSSPNPAETMPLKPLTSPPASTTPSPALAEPPRAEAVSPATGLQHTVAKGETLTSIAKHYNLSIADLHKANKVVDDRKLQIGQVLTIPAPQKSTESATDKKETP